MNEENEASGKAKGGKVKNALMTPEQRRAQAMKMVAAKKEKAELKKTLDTLPKASYRGEIKIGDMTLACCVLEDGRRLISENAINSNLGSSGGKTYRLRDTVGINSDGGPLPLFLASKALHPFIYKVFDGADLLPVDYSDKDKMARGFEASILPKVCEVWLQAAESGTLQSSQKSRVKKAEILIRGLARVGIIALVDEATGYQKDRARDALAKILEAFVAKELQPYIKKFPAEFYEEMFRLRGLPFDPTSVKRPPYFGHLTNDIVYRRLAPGVWLDLKAKAKKNAEGRPTHQLHRLLTPDVGDPRLKDLITKVVTVMQLSDQWPDFKAKLDRVAPAFDETLQLPFELQNDNGQGL